MFRVTKKEIRMYQRFHHKEKISQVLSKVQSQSSFNVTPQVHSSKQCLRHCSFITKVQIVLSLFRNHCRYYYKKKDNSKIAEYLEMNASIYYGNSRVMLNFSKKRTIKVMKKSYFSKK